MLFYLSPKLSWWSKIKLVKSILTEQWSPRVRFNNGVEFDLDTNRIIFNNPTMFHSTENFYLSSDKHLIMNSGQTQVPGAPDGYMYSIAQNTNLDDDGNPILLRTAYISRRVLNVDEFRNWFINQGVDPVHVMPHVTICYSREPIDWLSLNLDKKNLTITPSNTRISTFDKSANVMQFDNDELSNRHYEFLNLGASSDYDKYNPHITICYGNIDMTNIKPFPGKIELGPEILRDI